MVLPKRLVRAVRYGARGGYAAIQKWFSPRTGTRDPDEKDAYGNTLLHWAAHIANKTGRIETMCVLLAHGASVDASNSKGETPLHFAALNGHCAAAVLLLDHGARVNGRPNTRSDKTPLVYAAERRGDNFKEMIRLLLHRGAYPLGFRLGKSLAADLLADVRRAGGWRSYVRYPRFRLLMLRINAGQGRAETQDPLLRRLFPTGPPITDGARLKAVLEESDFRDIDAEALAAILVAKGVVKEFKRPREAYRAQKGGRLPRGIFVHILGYWRSSRDYLGPASEGA